MKSTAQGGWTGQILHNENMSPPHSPNKESEPLRGDEHTSDLNNMAIMNWPTTTESTVLNETLDIDDRKSATDSAKSSQNANRFPKSWYYWMRIQRQKCDILILAFVTAGPMVAFTATILAMVLGYKYSTVECAHADFCSTSKNMSINGTADTQYYYVDFPAARLVFIASWSSTVGFSTFHPKVVVTNASSVQFCFHWFSHGIVFVLCCVQVLGDFSSARSKHPCADGVPDNDAD